jgi:hypothetical protein
MILIKIMIFCISALSMIAGIVTMVSPDVNTVFLPIVVESVQEAHFARSYAGFVAAVGYLAMRFLYSSSKVQVGTVVLYIIFIMSISKIFSFIYDGYTTIAVYLSLWVLFLQLAYMCAKSKKKSA